MQLKTPNLRIDREDWTSVLSKGTLDEQGAVREEVAQVRDFVGRLTLDDLKTGQWFTALLRFALVGYDQQVSAEYFRSKYPNLPPDAIAKARVQLASRYSMIEGGLSATAYTSVVAATIGSGGGASPLTIPAGGAAFAVDSAYTSYRQLRMAYDLSVIYAVPFDINDSEDLWKLVRLAFGIKSGELGSQALGKAVPAVVRPLVKKFYAGTTLATAKSLPVVGRYLLQRNVIKFAVPAVGIPMTVAANYWTTNVAGESALKLLRRQARLREAATRLVARREDQTALVWIMCWVASAEGVYAESQRSLLDQVTQLVADAGGHEELLDRVRKVVVVDARDVRAAVASSSADPQALFDAALLMACVDGTISKEEGAVLAELAELLDVEYDTKRACREATSWK